MREPGQWTVRPAEMADRDLVRGVMEGARWRHQHLDWAGALELLESQPYLLAEDQRLPVGILACPPDPPGVSWIRMFASASGYRPQDVWNVLWAQALPLARALGVHTVAALSLNPWLEPLLTTSGFNQTNAVVFMEWDTAQALEPQAADADLRDLEPLDLEQVAEVDERAFAPIWRHSLSALELAFDQASLARGIFVHDSLAGYQISTASAFGAHLARLAVVPEAQHHGLGRALVVDVLRYFSERGYARVTVNTQLDNETSQTLYRKLGFLETGQTFPVFEREA
jgi:ribosomal-protein-alanine N-acetyltransferase